MKKFPLLLSLGVSAFFFACGDDSSSATNSETIADESSSSESTDTELSSSSEKEGDSPVESSSSKTNTPVRPQVEKAGFVTWYGDEGIYRINTGRDAGSQKSGLWYSYTDNSNGGASQIKWPVPLGEGADGFKSVIDYCGGICGNIVLDQGSLDYRPYVGLSFNIAGEDKNGKQMTADVTDMKGLCISYVSDFPAKLKLGLGDSLDKEINYSNHDVYLPKAEYGTVQKFAWSDFTQTGFASQEISIETAIKNIATFTFEISELSGTEGFFNIISIGAYDGECLIPSTSIVPEEVIPEVNFQLDSISAMVQKQLLAELGVKGNYPNFPNIMDVREERVSEDKTEWRGSLFWYALETGIGTDPHPWYTFSKEPEPIIAHSSYPKSSYPEPSPCKALCLTIDAKPSVYYGAGADLVAELQAKGANLSKYKQINLAYTSTTLPLDIVLVPKQNEALIGDDIYEINQGDNFRITLPATGDKISEVTLLFKDFAQEGWGVKQNIDDVIKELGAIQFAINGYKIDFKSEESISTDITIYGLGWE